MPLAPGQKLAAYEIVSALGAGGMGEVFRARDTRLGRDVALKILPPAVTKEPGRLERFDREARAIAALNHPHIVTIYSTEEADGMRFLTMELVDGHTLSDLVVSSGMAIPRFLEVAVPLADALAAAHQKQITHRDLKPGNVMISNDGRVKVLDFGLARVGGTDFGEHSLAATAAPITNLGVIVGTMPYMSPEQVEGRTIDARSDLFSLGVIFYELLSGKRPFGGGSSPALMSAILRDTPPSVSATRADVPEALERLVDRLIEKRPEDRVQTARDVFNELKHLRKQIESSSSGRSSSMSGGATPPLQNLWIAVLPFTVRGADHDAAELAAGLAEDIAAGLARFQVFNVVAAQSTRAYKDSTLDVRQIADRLGARYVIGGNVRTSARAVRTTAQLIDASSGAQLWSESYDRDATAMDLFAIQDDVTDHIVATIGDQSGVLARSMAKAVRSHLPSAEQTSRELMLRAWGVRHNTEPVEHAELREAIETRLATEADNADLWAELAHLYLDEQILVLNPLPDPLGRALRAARRSVEIDPNNQPGWTELAAACFFTKDRAGLFDGGERAIAINPRNAYTLGWIGNLFTHAGEYERGSQLSERGMAINPRHPGWCHIGTFNKHFAAGDYEAALRSARRVNMPDLNWSFFVVATAAAHLNLMDEAKRAADRMVAITPQLANPQVLRELTEMWFWEPAMVDTLMDGVLEALDARGTAVERSSERSHERSSERSSKPPSSQSSSPGHGALTVAVLPFVARSSDEESTTLADALTDDITTGLSRFGYLRVVSRSAVDRVDRSSRAQARYTIEGNVRKAGPIVRVGVTLVDTETATNLWTTSYDRDVGAGAFTIQDDVSSAIVATIGDQTGILVRAIANATADRPIDELSVGEVVIRYHLYTENFRPDEHARLRGAFERALEKEPRSAEGWACLSLLYEQEHGFHFNTLPDAPGRQRRAAERAVEINPRSQSAWVALASANALARDLEALKAAVERVAEINPLNADLVALGGLFLSVAGEHERATELVNRSIQLKPQHPPWYHFPLFNYHYVKGDYEAALREIKKISVPGHPFFHLGAAAVAGHLGREVEARAALAGLRAISPGLVEPAGARAYWATWIWSEEWLDSLGEGFTKAKEIADRSSERSSERSDGRSDGRSDVRADVRSGAGAARLTPVPVTVRAFRAGAAEATVAVAEGLTTDIATRLARFPHIRVVSAEAVATISGKHRYAIEGDVRESGNTIRINVRLIDLVSGAQIWAQHYDNDAGLPTFDIVDPLADRIVTTVADGHGEVLRALAQDPELASNLAIRFFAYIRHLTAEEHASLRDAYEAVVAADPDSVDGWGRLAVFYLHEATLNFNQRPDTIPRARNAAERAVALDSGNQTAWFAMALVCHLSRDKSGFFSGTERALELNPLSSSVTGTLGAMLSQAGETARGAALVRRAMSLTPHHRPWFFVALFSDAFIQGDADQALEHAQRSSAAQVPFAKLFTVAAAGRFGKADAAKQAIDEWRHANGDQPFDLDTARGQLQRVLWPSRFLDAMIEGLQKAITLVRSEERADDRSIAVLPFTDLSEKKDQDWFCDGIAEEIMNALASLPGLRVAARASAFSFRGRADDLEAIGEKLNVNTVLEGSVRRSGDRVRITARLSDTREGRQLWSERFDRELKDIFDVQDEIARAIADRLRLSISGGGARLVQKTTTNLEAYELLLKGRTFLNRRGPAIVNAIPCFERAIALDPNLADAHAGLGDTYRLFGVYSLMPTKEAMQLARTSLERALAIEPDQVEALATLANITSMFDWNYAKAQELTDRALRRDPSHVRALAESAVTTASLMADRPSDELRELVLERIRRARALDPLSAWAMAIEAMILVMLGREQEAIEVAKKAVATDPNNFTAHWSRVFTLAQLGRKAEAEEAAQPGLAMSSRHPMLLSDLATLHAREGEVAKAESIYQELIERSKTAFISPAATAVAAAAAGHLAEARTLLAQAIADRDAFLDFNKLAAWRPIWDDPECAAMLRGSELMRNAPA